MKIKKILKYSFITLSIAVLIYGTMFISTETNAQPSMAGKNNPVSFMDNLKASRKSQNEEAIKNLYKQYISYKKANNYESMYEMLDKLIKLQLDSKIYETKISETESIDVIQMEVALIDLSQLIGEPTDSKQLNKLINLGGGEHLKKKHQADFLALKGLLYSIEKDYGKEETILKKVINLDTNQDKFYAYFHLVNSYIVQEKYDEGIIWANKAETYLQNANNIKSKEEKLCRLYIIQAQLYRYRKNRDIKKALLYADKVNDLYVKANLENPILYMKYLNAKALALSLEKDYKNAIKYNKESVDLKNQLFKDKNRFEEIDKLQKIYIKFLEETENGR